MEWIPSLSGNMPRSSVPEICLPAVPGPQAAALLAMLFELEQTQWWPTQRLLDLQRRQLDILARYAQRALPFYRERFKAAGIDPGRDPIASWWPHLPPLTRAQVQAAGTELTATPPLQHGRTSQLQTSGSTGQPVVIQRTELASNFWHLFAMRLRLWHGRDFRGKSVAIRGSGHGYGPQGLQRPDWGLPTTLLFDTGPSALLDVAYDIAHQKRWLIEQNPRYLTTHPTNLDALLTAFEADGERLPDLQDVQTLSEAVTPELRARCRRILGVPIINTYTSEEVGFMAIQAPGHEHLLVQAESVCLELLDDDGRPAAPGEPGVVVLTPLHNFATILLRYQIEDFAEAGPPCPTGRGLPTLSRILGRRRNMLVLPDGSRHWPSFPVDTWMHIVTLRQMQLVQTAVDRIEARVVVDQPMSAEQSRRFVAAMQERLRFPYPIEIVYVPEIPKVGRRQKFEEFLSLVQ